MIILTKKFIGSNHAKQLAGKRANLNLANHRNLRISRSAAGSSIGLDRTMSSGYNSNLIPRVQKGHMQFFMVSKSEGKCIRSEVTENYGSW